MKLIIVLAILVAVVAVFAKRRGKVRQALSMRVGRILAICYGGIVGLIIGNVAGEVLSYGGAHDNVSGGVVIASVIIVTLGWYLFQLRRETGGN